MKVAIQGYEGSFHHIVAERYWGEGIEIVPCPTFREVARQVESGDSDCGVMAIENSIAGSILPNLGILHNSRLQAVGEYYLHIRQNLMALPACGWKISKRCTRIRWRCCSASISSIRTAGSWSKPKTPRSAPAGSPNGHAQRRRDRRRTGGPAVRTRNFGSRHPYDQEQLHPLYDSAPRPPADRRKGR